MEGERWCENCQDWVIPRRPLVATHITSALVFVIGIAGIALSVMAWGRTYGFQRGLLILAAIAGLLFTFQGATMLRALTYVRLCPTCGSRKLVPRPTG